MILCNIKLGRIIEWHSYHLCAIIKTHHLATGYKCTK